MVKCIVSGCPNREVDVNRGIFNRPKKRFFSFPEDPTRVKVWLAALRETEKQDSAEQHLICEDHFLPEDISADGVSSDAIPIMPPCLDGALSMLSHWGPESSEEEEEEEEEEDQWADGGAGGDDEDEGGDDVAANTEPPAAEPPAPASPKQDPVAKRPLEAYVTSNNLGRKASSFQGKSFCRYDVSLALLTTRFLELMLRTPDCSLDLRQVTTIMKTRKRRVYDITNVLSGISLIEKQSANRIKWIGSVPIQNFLSAKNQKFQKELDDLKLVEDTLDTLIKSCAQQLFDMTDDLQNSASAYVTHRDVSRLAAFQEQTVIIVKAPEETKLEVPAPTEDSIQIHLKGSNGPITVLTCDMGTEKGQKSSCFLTLEEGPIKTAALHTGNDNTRSHTLGLSWLSQCCCCCFRVSMSRDTCRAHGHQLTTRRRKKQLMNLKRQLDAAQSVQRQFRLEVKPESSNTSVSEPAAGLYSAQRPQEERAAASGGFGFYTKITF